MYTTEFIVELYEDLRLETEPETKPESEILSEIIHKHNYVVSAQAYIVNLSC